MPALTLVPPATTVYDVPPSFKPAVAPSSIGFVTPMSAVSSRQDPDDDVWSTSTLLPEISRSPERSLPTPTISHSVYPTGWSLGPLSEQNDRSDNKREVDGSNQTPSSLNKRDLTEKEKIYIWEALGGAAVVGGAVTWLLRKRIKCLGGRRDPADPSVGDAVSGESRARTAEEVWSRLEHLESNGRATAGEPGVNPGNVTLPPKSFWPSPRA